MCYYTINFGEHRKQILAVETKNCNTISKFNFGDPKMTPAWFKLLILGMEAKGR
jgi:hypothetical protein